MTNVRNSSCALLADQHTIAAEGIRALLGAAFDSVYVVGDVESLRDGAQRLQPTIVTLDVNFATSGSLELTSWIRAHSPQSKLIVLTCLDQQESADASLSAGADAVVLKRCVAYDLLAAVDAVLKNEKFVSPDIGTTV